MKKYSKKEKELFELAKKEKECDCRKPHPLIVFAKMPDDSWHEPGCEITQRYIKLVPLKATGKVCHSESDGRKFFCHHKKGFSCKECMKLIRGY